MMYDVLANDLRCWIRASRHMNWHSFDQVLMIPISRSDGAYHVKIASGGEEIDRRGRGEKKSHWNANVAFAKNQRSFDQILKLFSHKFRIR